ncbi:O-antigen biosynthesis glycosyltransferase WbnK [bioreactor metagenome]|uniref:O-antigen biosynthesis glycosyltransferase WbnK n=1 Tax=bioreactor metagenome TaxID=1076179 RepID=A0A644WSJ0_9ZZZZ
MIKLKYHKLILNKRIYNEGDYIYVYMVGRIGNVMFQIAAASTLAKKHNCKLIAIPALYKVSEPDNCLLIEYLQQFKKTILRNVDICIKPPTIYRSAYFEPYFHYNPIIYLPNIFIKGYFQSEKYFNRNLVNELFRIDDATSKVINDKYGEILSLPGITSINVRRGDYLKLSDYHPICTLDYYNRAIDIIGRDRPYLITSDDLNWCRKNFVGDYFYFADYTSPTYDLYLQTMCKNNIISNSTFSWWGAWLNNDKDKLVISPKKWFGPKYAINDTKDLIPSEWIKT